MTVRSGHRPEQARSFDAWAVDYDRYRPGYPDELFATISRALDLPVRPEVADLGAGTGRATLAMARRGWRVTAIEPGAAMLDPLRRAADAERLGVTVRQATAEETGLADASVDLVTAAQAFHWFDRPRAVVEMGRIVRRGGGAAMFWNVRDDESSPFLAAYTDLLQRYVPGYEPGAREMRGRPVATRGELASTGAFEPPEFVQLPHEMRMDADRFIGLAFTSSYVRVRMDHAEQARFRDELAALIARHHGDAPFSVPYQIDLWIARRRSA
ncbi:MAG: class I SAM-dependent methyltransferase [Candidatus Limnocylindria bacterium]